MLMGMCLLVFLIKTAHNPVNVCMQMFSPVLNTFFESSWPTKEQACALDFKEIGGKEVSVRACVLSCHLRVKCVKSRVDYIFLQL